MLEARLIAQKLAGQIEEMRQKSIFVKPLLTGRIYVIQGEEESNIPEDGYHSSKIVVPEITRFGRALFGTTLLDKLSSLRDVPSKKEQKKVMIGYYRRVAEINKQVKDGIYRVVVYDENGKVENR